LESSNKTFLNPTGPKSFEKIPIFFNECWRKGVNSLSTCWLEGGVKDVGILVE